MELIEIELPCKQTVRGWACFDPFVTKDEYSRMALDINPHRIHFCDDVRKARCDANKQCGHYKPRNPYDAEAMALGRLNKLGLTKGMTIEQRAQYRKAMYAVCADICRELWENCHSVTITIRENDVETPS